jgi:hypothetical protein
MANYTHTPTTYADAREIYRQHARRARGRDVLPYVRLGYATTLHARGVMLTGADRDDAPAYAVRQHNTDVVTFYRDGVIRLDHGGWTTVTTCERWNAFTPRELSVNAVDVMARRADADPRFIVSTGAWESVNGALGDAYQRRAGEWTTLATSRGQDRATYLTRWRDGWRIATDHEVDRALASTTTRKA